GGMGNKGAIGVRVAWDAAVTLVFASAHLAPHEWGVARRNRDVHSIVGGLVFGPEEGGEGERGIYPTQEKELVYTFLLGDLNYRTAALRPRKGDAATLFPRAGARRGEPGHWAQLLGRDQLKVEMAAGRV